MQWIDKKRLASELLAGTFLNMGSTVSVEIAAQVGFDWLLLDCEHGSGSLADLRQLLLACKGHRTSPIVRIRSVDPDTVKFVMDSGAAGIMFPFVSSADSAEKAVKAIKYPPRGERGVAGIIRATDYGQNWKQYFDTANENSLVVVQIETEQAVHAADEIAAVEGVDVLFVGPLDLSVSLGCPGDFSQPKFIEALEHVVEVCKSHGKTPGILSKPGFSDAHLELGFRFFALGSDSGSVIAGARQSLFEIRGKA